MNTWLYRRRESMGWLDWLTSTLRHLKLRRSARYITLVFLGLDNAGNSTLLGKILGKPQPRLVHPNRTEPEPEPSTLKAYSLGGHRQVRALWKNYFTQVDGVVFLVDATNVERLGESKEQLELLLTDDMLQKVPFAILGNKIDMPTALSEPALKQALGVADQCTGKERKQQKGTFRPCEVFMCSGVKGFGYGDAFRWLSEYVP